MVYFLCKAYDSDRQNCYFAQSLPVRGAWIEISTARPTQLPRRSLPVRGAWIEIWKYNERHAIDFTSLPVRGAWIEMLNARPFVMYGARRSPCGERGLK